MTRSALRRAIYIYQQALVEFFASGNHRLPNMLARAGFKRLPESMLGVERDVLLGRGMVVKTAGWRTELPAWSPRFRRMRSFAPTISISKNVVVQPLGRVLDGLDGPKWAAVRRKYERVAEYVERRFDITDTHDKNYALFPDGSVRCIDY